MANTNQSIMISKIAAASRLPETSDLRRDALLGGVVSSVNPLAGAIVEVRVADKVSDLDQQLVNAQADNQQLRRLITQLNEAAKAIAPQQGALDPQQLQNLTLLKTTLNAAVQTSQFNTP